jgi:carbonic anhydrase
MTTIDYIYRYNPASAEMSSPPSSGDEARERLETGNRKFSQWMAACRAGEVRREGPHVVDCNGQQVGLVTSDDSVPTHAPFAAIVGCCDARVPAELLFGQGFNDLFVIRVVGNALGQESLGSVDYAAHKLPSVKCVVVLGHSDCGALTGAVMSYLDPKTYWHMPELVRPVLQRFMPAVREADRALQQVWRDQAIGSNDKYRKALINIAICLNAAQAGYELRLQVQQSVTRPLDVLFGVHNVATHQVTVPCEPGSSGRSDPIKLARVPRDPDEFASLARQMAESLQKA